MFFESVVQFEFLARQTDDLSTLASNHAKNGILRE